MKLVIIILLLCVHSADPTDCNGVKDQVVFCPKDGTLEITITTGESVTWDFKGGNLPTGNSIVTPSGSVVMTLPNLKAEHSGLYKATYDPSIVEKFTIIVDRAPCSAGSECDVMQGGSINLDSGEPSGVTWHFKAPSGSETEITDTANDPPKFTAGKKELGLLNMKKAQSGKYTAKKPGENNFPKEFPVAVRAPISKATVNRKKGCDMILECNVIGDAKSFKWTKGQNDVPDATQKQLTIPKADVEAKANYVCKATGHDKEEKPSEVFAYTYTAPQPVSDVSITRKGKVLTCEARGDVQSFKWEMKDGTGVTSQHGKVDLDVASKFNLTPKAKGNFVCVATGCDGKDEKSDLFSVDGEGSKEDGSSTNDDESDNNRKPGEGARGLQGASTSVALLLICVLVELYVMML
ncbi:uncharacterized protein ACBT44_013637 [Syngnathus typhle]